MKNLSPEVAESLKSLREAADMVNRPFETKAPEDLSGSTTNKDKNIHE